MLPTQRAWRASAQVGALAGSTGAGTGKAAGVPGRAGTGTGGDATSPAEGRAAMTARVVSAPQMSAAATAASDAGLHDPGRAGGDKAVVAGTESGGAGGGAGES